MHFQSDKSVWFLDNIKKNRQIGNQTCVVGCQGAVQLGVLYSLFLEGPTKAKGCKAFISLWVLLKFEKYLMIVASCLFFSD